MKLRLSAVFALFLMFALASCRTDRLTGPPNPPATVSDTIALFTFQGNTKDVTGNGHDALVNGQFQYAPDRFGNSSGAFALTTQNFMQVYDKNDLDFPDSQSFSLTAWVKTTSNDGNIIDKLGEDGWQLRVNGGFADGWIGNSDTGVDLISHAKINDGQWHFVALSVSFQAPGQASEILYVDSNIEASQMNGGLLWAEPLQSEIEIGRSFNAVIGEIAIYSKALSFSDVTARFHEGGWYEHTDTVVVTPPPPTDSIWTPVDASTSNDLVVGQFVNSTTGFVGGAYGVFLATNDSGATWSIRTSPTIFTGSLTGHIYGLSFFDANHGVVAGDQRDISITSDGGNNWAIVDASNLPQTDLIRSLYFTNRNTGFVGTADVYANPSGSICRSNDGGQTWSAPIISTGGGIYNIDFNTLSNNQNGVATGNYGVVYWTNDGGTTWNPGTSDLSTGVIIRTTFMTATTAFAVGYVDDTHGYILRSDDGGHSWRTIKTVPYGLSGIASNGNFLQTDASPRRITAVGNGGAIIESTDGGVSWSTSFQGSSRLYDIRYSSHTRAVIFGVNGMIAVRNQ